MNPANIVRDIYNEATEIPEPFSTLSAAEKRTALRLLKRFEEAEAKHGTLPHSDILRPLLLSKNGRHDEALAYTERNYEQNPTWATAIAVANAARRAGDLDKSVVMFTKSSEYDPNDVTCWLEVGDIHLEADRWTEALAAYEKALANEPNHQWALPSAFYCRHRLKKKGKWLASLQEVANQEGCTCGLEGCLTALLGVYGASRGIARAEYLLERLER